MPIAAIAGAAAGGGIVLTTFLFFLLRWINKRRQRKLEDDILRPPGNTPMAQTYGDSGPRGQRDSGYNPYIRDTIITTSSTGGYAVPMPHPDALGSGPNSRPRAMSSDSQPGNLSVDGSNNLGPPQLLQLRPSSLPTDVTSSTNTSHGAVQYNPEDRSAGSAGVPEQQGGAGNRNQMHNMAMNGRRTARNDPGADIGPGGGGYSGLPEV